MTTSYIRYTPEQALLLPPSLQEWLPEGHLAYFISDTVDALDLSAFHEKYASGGPRNQPFHPAMMVKVLIYGYATGVFSSRKLARKLHIQSARYPTLQRQRQAKGNRCMKNASRHKAMSYKRMLEKEPYSLRNRLNRW